MPSPFVIPGVTLEEVLGAAKTDTGRRLYTLAATAAKDLADHVRERRDDGDLEPVELGGAPASAPPAEAGAPSHPSPATVSRSTPIDEDLLSDAERAVRAYLDGNRGAWHSPRELVAALEFKASAVGDALRTWRLLRVIEHNGKLRTAARYRIPLQPAPADRGDEAASIVDDLREERDALRADAELEEALKPADVTFGPGAAGPPAVSRRVRRELEAEAERQRREAQPPPATNGNGTLDGQALHELCFRPATIPELAARLRIAPRDAAAVIRRLEDDGDLERRGRRSGEIIYAGLA